MSRHRPGNSNPGRGANTGGAVPDAGAGSGVFSTEGGDAAESAAEVEAGAGAAEVAAAIRKSVSNRCGPQQLAPQLNAKRSKWPPNRCITHNFASRSMQKTAISPQTVAERSNMPPNRCRPQTAAAGQPAIQNAFQNAAVGPQIDAVGNLVPTASICHLLRRCPEPAEAPERWRRWARWAPQWSRSRR